VPTSLVKSWDRQSIALDVPTEFALPILDSRLRYGGAAATGMLVPKAAMYKQRYPPLGKNKIGLTRQIGSMQPEAKT
jgi:hypothetical protein